MMMSCGYNVVTITAMILHVALVVNFITQATGITIIYDHCHEKVHAIVLTCVMDKVYTAKTNPMQFMHVIKFPN